LRTFEASPVRNAKVTPFSNRRAALKNGASYGSVRERGVVSTGPIRTDTFLSRSRSATRHASRPPEMIAFRPTSSANCTAAWMFSLLSASKITGRSPWA
jgi:hypothetical protein